MNRIDRIFGEARAQGRKAFMPFVCAGHPTAKSTPGILGALASNGADVIEIGFPFSDPIADGPVIAAAMHEALEKGFQPRDAFEAVRRFRAKGTRATEVGLVAMVSVSIVHRFGGKEFVSAAAEAGLDGFIFPDLSLEESGTLREIVRGAGLTMSLLIAPTTPPDRAAEIASACSGFVYLLARKGITGVQARPADSSLAERVNGLRAATRLPIACGFGISSAKDVRAVVWDAGADAAIVGSALVQRLTGSADPVGEAASFARELCTGLERPGVSASRRGKVAHASG